MQFNFEAVQSGIIHKGSILFFYGRHGMMSADVVYNIEKNDRGIYFVSLVDMEYRPYSVAVFPTFETDMYTEFAEAFHLPFDAIAYSDSLIDEIKRLSYIVDTAERDLVFKDMEFTKRALQWNKLEDDDANEYDA